MERLLLEMSGRADRFLGGVYQGFPSEVRHNLQPGQGGHSGL